MEDLIIEDKLIMVPYHKSFSNMLRSIGQYCDVNIVYVGKKTAIKYNLQFGSFCFLKQDNEYLTIRIYIDHRVEDGTILLSNYIVKNIFTKHQFIEIVPQKNYNLNNNEKNNLIKVVREINVTCENIPSHNYIENKNKMYIDVFKQYATEYNDCKIPVINNNNNNDDDNKNNRFIIKDENVIFSYVVVVKKIDDDEDTNNNNGRDPFHYILDTSSTKINFISNTKCNETRELQLKNDEKDNLAFSINIVKSIQSLNTIFDNMIHFIDIHTNKLAPAFKKLLPRSMILYGLSGSGRTSICKALVSNLKELYGLENIIYSSMMISATTSNSATNNNPSKQSIFNSNNNSFSLIDIYNKIIKMDKPYVIILDQIDFLLINRKDGGVIMNNMTKEYKYKQTLLLKIIDFTIQSKSQSFIICTGNSRFQLNPELIKPDRLGRIFEIKRLDNTDRFNALKLFMTKYTISEKDRSNSSSTTPATSNKSKEELLKAISSEATDGFALKHLDNVVKSSYFKSISLPEAVNMLKPFIHHDAAKILVPTNSFETIGGYNMIKQRLLQLNQSNSNKIKIKTKRVTGILLHGPSGCGKTKLVEAFAHETNSYLILLRASALLSPYLGESERALRETFKNASMSSKAILFIDEIDAIIPSRNFDKNSNGNTSSIGIGERLLSTLLNCMDGLIENQNVLVVAATTRIEMVDPALRRPGRLGICIEIPFPNAGDVSKIFRLYMKKYCLETILNKYLQNEKETISNLVKKYYKSREKLMKQSDNNGNEQELTGAIIESICRGEAMNFLRNRISERMKEDAL